MKSRQILVAKIAALGLVISTSAALAFAPGDDDRRARRRTPVVEVFERCKDAVVYFTGPLPKDDSPPTAEFFNLPETRHETVYNVGSGFIVHPDGYVLTNAHAAEKTIVPEVVLSNGKKYRAELIAVVREQDLALLKIDAPEQLCAVQFAPAGELMIGETVIVIANPHGLRQTCTAGVLSAVGRSTEPSGLPGVKLQELIQTDAGINPGSSGGPWLNALGEAIGITVSRKSESDNIAFAISAAAMREELPDMLDVERRFGLSTGLIVPAGEPCKVAAVLADSPGTDAGIRADDVLAEIDGQPIRTGLDFHFALLGHKPRQKIKLQLLREGKPLEASLSLAARPKADGAALLKQKFGLTAVPLDEATAKATALRVPRGVVITAVDEEIYRNVKAPPLPGDVLARINYIRPRDLDHVGLLIERIKPGQVTKMVLLRLKDDLATRVDLTTTPRS